MFWGIRGIMKRLKRRERRAVRVVDSIVSGIGDVKKFQSVFRGNRAGFWHEEDWKAGRKWRGVRDLAFNPTYGLSLRHLFSGILEPIDL